MLMLILNFLKLIIKILFWAVLFWTTLLGVERVALVQQMKNFEWENWIYYIRVVVIVLLLNIVFSNNFNKYIKRNYLNRNDYLIVGLTFGYLFYFLYPKPISNKLFSYSIIAYLLAGLTVVLILYRFWNRRNFNIYDQEDIKAPPARLDKPLGKDDSDFFDRRSFAEQIGKIIYSTEIKISLVIGIFGEWGSGKSSILFMLEDFFKTNRGVAIIKFNSWLYKDTSNLCDDLFKSISMEISKQNGYEEHEILKSLAAYSKKLAEFKVVGSPISFNLLKDIVETDEGLMQLKDNVGNLLEKINFKIVIIIDDLDRLNCEEIFKVFQLVKLIGDFPQLVYILACDYEKVAIAISKAYYSDSDISMGKNFLEKIIQIPLHISSPEKVILADYFIKEVAEICRHAEIEVTNEINATLRESWNKTIGNLNWTIRKVNRLINVIAIILPIQKYNTNLVDVILIEALHLLFSKMYTYILINAEEFLQHGSINRQYSVDLRNRYNEILNSFDFNEKIVLESLIVYLFPMIQSDVVKEEEWTKEKRICSRKYFDNYFLYSVPQDTISDIKMSYFIDQVSAANSFEIQKEFTNLMTGKNYSKAFSTLGYVIERSKYEFSVLKEIGLLLASKVIKSDEEIFLCIKKVIIATPVSLQLELLKIITSAFTNFIEAVNLFHYILESRIDNNKKLELPNEEYKEYANHITIILQKILDKDKSYINNADLIKGLIKIWDWADKKNTEKNIDYILEFDLIEVFLFSIVENNINNVLKKNKRIFDEQDYNSLLDMYEPNKIANRLLEKYKNITEDDIKNSHNLRLGTAHEFMSVHSKYLNE